MRSWRAAASNGSSAQACTLEAARTQVDANQSIDRNGRFLHGLQIAHPFEVRWASLRPEWHYRSVTLRIGQFLIVVLVAPFSVKKEIEDDQNIALAIVIASVILGSALIIAAAVH